jgi:hypothetical protein
MVLWYGTLAVANYYAPSSSIYMWGGLLLGGLLAEIVCAFVLALKYPALLYSKKNENLGALFRFAFTFNAKVPDFYTRTRLNYVTNMDELPQEEVSRIAELMSVRDSRQL